MRVFFDTEFIESFHKPLFGKRRHFVDLISIGLTTDNGAELYLISNEFNPADADDWVRQNVLEKISYDFVMSYHGDQRNWILDIFDGWSLNKRIRYIQRVRGKSNKQIAYEIAYFTGCHIGDDGKICAPEGVQFYGHYADYDWVLLCSLFGRMIDLPKNYPMYCIDVKQIMDEKKITSEILKKNIGNPLQEHNALSDAIWVKHAYYFLTARA